MPPIPPVLFSQLAEACKHIVHKDPKDTKGGGKAQYATYAENKGYVYIQLDNPPKLPGPDALPDPPRTFLPFGISKAFDATKEADPRKNVDISLGSAEDIEKAFRAFDEWNIQDMAANSKVIFGREVPVEKIRTQYVSALKEDPAGKYEVRLRTKVSTEGSGIPKVTLLGDKGGYQEGKWNDLDAKGVVGLYAVRYSGRWFSSGRYGPTFEMANALIWPRQNSVPAFNFVWNGEAPVVNAAAASAPAPALAPASAPAAIPEDDAKGPPVDGYKFSMAT